MKDPILLLLPKPVDVRTDGRMPLKSCLAIGPVSPRTERAVAWIREKLAELGLSTHSVADGENRPDIRLHLDPAGQFPSQGYQLDAGRQGIEIRARDESGLFYGAVTLCQWIMLQSWPRSGHKDRYIDALRVEDFPDFPTRGVMLDISRNRVPTLETLFQLVDLFASLKINQLQLYMEHTFAYSGHEKVWNGWSPLTAEDIRLLDRHCASRYIELVPNQNSFGHFHKWLIHEPYRQLAECPEGIEHPFSEAKEPFSLCPLDSGSLDLLRDLYGELLPCFSSPWLNVGLDETLDLGLGRSASACAEKGKGRIYLDFLHQIHRLVGDHGKRMMFWGDIILQRPELIGELPKDAIAVEWGYEANHPFAADGRRFAVAGLEFHVCPGTSSWHSFAGRLDNALKNLANAAANGKQEGSSGYLIADWGDNGHLQPLAVSYPAFLAGAGFSWNTTSAGELGSLPLAELLDRHVYRDRSENLGQATIELGNAYLNTGAPPEGAAPINGSALFFLPMFAHKPPQDRRCAGLSPASLRQALLQVEEGLDRLRRVEGEGTELTLARRELAWAGQALELACHLGIPWLEAGLETPLGRLPRQVRNAASQRLESLMADFRSLWLCRCRPGGLEISAARLSRLGQMLNNDEPQRRIS